ncbi:hypothetical protein L2W11_09475 [Sediminivirga luteola]|nr:hypothetical protein [Sediminivirga luteola]MCI2265741.1 hypothetical protein [Sediminivirga luteola]
MKRSRVHVMGASGSGTTTLARALADHWAVPHADADDYFWVPAVPPFRQKRPEEARRSLTREVFVPREAWVLSGSMLGGDTGSTQPSGEHTVVREQGVSIGGVGVEAYEIGR